MAGIAIPVGTSYHSRNSEEKQYCFSEVFRATLETMGKPIRCPHCSKVLSERKLTEKQLALIEAKADGKTSLQAGLEAGYKHKPTIYRALSDATVVSAVEQRKLSKLDKTKALIKKSLDKVEAEIDTTDCDPRFALLAVKELSSYAERIGDGQSAGANLHEVTSADLAQARYKRFLSAIRFLEYGIGQPSKAGLLATKLRSSIGKPRFIEVSPIRER